MHRRTAARLRSFSVALLAAISGGEGGTREDESHMSSVQREWWNGIRRASATGGEAKLQSWSWLPARSVEELAAVVTLPHQAHKPVVVYFFAKWFGPNAEFENDVLGDPAVKARLIGFSKVYVDVRRREAPGTTGQEAVVDRCPHLSSQCACSLSRLAIQSHDQGRYPTESWRIRVSFIPRRSSTGAVIRSPTHRGGQATVGSPRAAVRGLECPRTGSGCERSASTTVLGDASPAPRV